MSNKLIVYTNPKTFDSYWYGYGKIEGIHFDDETGVYRIEVDYGEDDYHARFQEGRFASGLIFAEIIKEFE